MIDPHSDRAIYRQVADRIRVRIVSGEFQPGDSLPAEGSIAREWRIGRDTVRRAIALLRREGLVVTERGQRTHVKPRPTVRRIALQDVEGARAVESTISARMPNESERRSLGIAEGVPVLVVRRRVDGDDTTEEPENLYAADQVEFAVRP